MKRLVVLVAVILAVAGASGCSAVSAMQVTGIRFHWVGEGPEYDSSEYTVDSAGLDEFRRFFVDEGVDPRSYEVPGDHDCDTDYPDATLTFSDGSSRSLTVKDCIARDSSFEVGLISFFAYYAGTHVGDSHPNSSITSIRFRQAQSVDGFDYAAYTQSDPAEVARFAALLDAAGIVWADYSYSQFSEAIDPCASAPITSVTVGYPDVEFTGPPIDACRRHDAFTDGAAALFTEWREDLATQPLPSGT